MIHSSTFHKICSALAAVITLCAAADAYACICIGGTTCIGSMECCTLCLGGQQSLLVDIDGATMAMSGDFAVSATNVSVSDIEGGVGRVTIHNGDQVIFSERVQLSKVKVIDAARGTEQNVMAYNEPQSCQ